MTTRLFSMTNMNRICIIFFIILVIFPSTPKAEENTAIHHEMKIVLYPEEQRFVAEDSITVPEYSLPDLSFFLHEGLSPLSPTPGVSINSEKVITGELHNESLRVKLPP